MIRPWLAIRGLKMDPISWYWLSSRSLDELFVAHAHAHSPTLSSNSPAMPSARIIIHHPQQRVSSNVVQSRVRSDKSAFASSTHIIPLIISLLNRNRWCFKAGKPTRQGCSCAYYAAAYTQTHMVAGGSLIWMAWTSITIPTHPPGVPEDDADWFRAGERTKNGADTGRGAVAVV